MKKISFAAALAIIAISASAVTKTSWPTESDKYPSWPVIEGKFPKYPYSTANPVCSWPGA
jgi:hypothetical protein